MQGYTFKVHKDTVKIWNFILEIQQLKFQSTRNMFSKYTNTPPEYTCISSTHNDIFAKYKVALSIMLPEWTKHSFQNTQLYFHTTQIYIQIKHFVFKVQGCIFKVYKCIFKSHRYNLEIQKV